MLILTVLIFFIISLAKGLSILSLLKNKFLVSLAFPIVFLFSSTLISAMIDHLFKYVVTLVFKTRSLEEWLGQMNIKLVSRFFLEKGD